MALMPVEEGLPMRLNILGPFEVSRDGTTGIPSAPKLRRVLALLAVQANTVVRNQQLMDELWDGEPPRSASTSLQTYIYRLRRHYRLSEFAGDESEAALCTSGNGYRLLLPPGALDANRFTTLVERGRSELKADKPEAALKSLRTALRLWRGPLFSDIEIGPVTHAATVWLEEMRKSVLEQRFDLEIELGRHGEVIEELTGLVAEEPTHEGFQAKLMLALHRSGRRPEALRVYQHVRQSLGDELGLEPSAELQRLHHAVLNAAEEPEPVPRRTVARLPVRERVPDQLSPDVPGLRDREPQLAVAQRALSRQDGDQAPAVVAVVGSPGNGKSAFAVHLAHRVREAYPDGRFHVQLHGADGTVASPHDVLARLLGDLGVPSQRIPESTVERSALFREWTADLQVLLVLDDVVAMDQVRALLPSSPGSAVVMACRRRLADPFVTATVTLPPLTEAGALGVLEDSLGARTGDRLAVHELAAYCHGVPLLLRTAASLMELRPHWPVEWLLRDSGRRLLHGRSVGQASLHNSVWRSHELLSGAARRVFGVLATAEGPASIPDVAGRLGTSEEIAETLLEELVEFQLAEPECFATDFADLRYRLHPPLSEVAKSIAGPVEPPRLVAAGG